MALCHYGNKKSKRVSIGSKLWSNNKYHIVHKLYRNYRNYRPDNCRTLCLPKKGTLYPLYTTKECSISKFLFKEVPNRKKDTNHQISKPRSNIFRVTHHKHQMCVTWTTLHLIRQICCLKHKLAFNVDEWAEILAGLQQGMHFFSNRHC